MAKYTFQFSNQVNFEAEDFSSVHKLLTFLEDENERLKAQEQSASFALQKIDKNGKVIANFERIDFPIDIWDEQLFEPLYEHNDRYLKKHPELASIIISEKPQDDLVSSVNDQPDVSSKTDESWEKAFLEASEKELLEQDDEQAKEEVQSFPTYAPEEQEPPVEVTSKPTVASTLNEQIPPVISNNEYVTSYSDVAQETTTADPEVVVNDSWNIQSQVEEKLSEPLAVTPDKGMDHINILDHMTNSDDQELSQLLSEISSFVDQKLTSYTSKLEYATNQELQSIDRREDIKKMLLDQCSELTQTQIKALTEQLTQEKTRAISDEQTRHQNELARIESEFSSRLAQGRQNIEVTNISNTQKEIEKSQFEIISTLSNYAKTKAEQNQGKLQLMKAKLQDTFSSIFKKNILKESSYHNEILSKFSTNTVISTPDENFKIKSLNITQTSTEQSSAITSQKHHMVQ